MIVIVDYHMGNVGSIKNMLLRAGYSATISADPAVLAAASKLILPGVGAFDTGMRNIAELGLREVLDRKALKERVPTLGICLGMQLLGASSEEGTLAGLSWIEAKSVKFVQPKDGTVLRVPHMGWNVLTLRRTGRLFANLSPNPRYYFVHSYHVVCQNEEDVVAVTNYGGEVVASVERGNIFGAQFHPEKSHRFGMEILQNFASLEL